ncbi:alpha-hydroxyketone-type quorum-sensing autoinducer synthase [Actinomadura parmotrematis]|uniref:8-amino-7-oxononanoate synthase n=1 Tax=Actinomadura parmotrematis TaxID=2864039 RepID=A0ABS7G2W3_9ACTN|nr:alpha-hydroxyketone-type quorum-sensing autoinducer synthase [Actinomadura parmotrematis]MBW8487054.1 quorum-sensing autoinducer CAI-1 synthase [Actinomadura parmotrematis]
MDEPVSLTARLDAWDARRAGWGGALFQGRAAPGPGAEVLMSNDYLAIGAHPHVVERQVAALRAGGCGALMSGAHLADGDPQRALEARLAAFLDAPSVRLCQSGWAANVGLVQAIAPPCSPVYVDAAAHASLRAGIDAARAAARVFAHNDTGHLERLIGRHGPGLIAVDTLYSVGGDFCPLPEIVEVAERSGCAVVADESHTLGVLGPDGAGLVPALGLAGRVAYRTASLAKAFAGRAGLVACDRRVGAYLPYHAHPAVFSTALLPHDVAGLAAVLDLVEIGDRRRARLARNAALLRDGLAGLGYNIAPSRSHIVSLRPGGEDALCRLQGALDAEGVFGAPFAHPAVGRNGAALRFSVHAGLTKRRVARILDACAAVRDTADVTRWRSTRRLAAAR